MEVADLVQDALEKNGTFSSLKAQLRASVQKVIEGSTSPTCNAAVAQLSKSDDGLKMILLLQDALSSLGLEQTLLALKAECGDNLGSKENVPSDLARNMNLNLVEGEPVLLAVVRALREPGSRPAASVGPDTLEKTPVAVEDVAQAPVSAGGTTRITVRSAEPEPEPRVAVAAQARVARLGQGAVTRSSAGWDVKADDYTDDFLDEDSAAGPETELDGDREVASGPADHGLKVAEWDDASDDFDSSHEAPVTASMKSSLSGLGGVPPRRPADAPLPLLAAGNTGWGAVAAAAPPARGGGGEEDSGHSIEEEVSEEEEEEKAGAARGNRSDSESESDAAGQKPVAVLMESKADSSSPKRSNQEEDLYDNDFSMEPGEKEAPDIAAGGADDDDYEQDDYEQDDFEFEEDGKSFLVDAKDDDARDHSVSLDQSTASEASSVFGSSKPDKANDEAARLEEVDRKLAALEQADNSLKGLRKSPEAKKPTRADDFEVDEYDSIDEILSDSVSSDEGLSVGGADSASDSFLNESDSRGFLAESSRGSAAAKTNGQGRATNTSSNNSLASSIEFSVTEHEVSGSNAGLEDVDFSARALPPARGKRTTGW